MNVLASKVGVPCSSLLPHKAEKSYFNSYSHILDYPSLDPFGCKPWTILLRGPGKKEAKETSVVEKKVNSIACNPFVIAVESCK